jgi:PhoH-like ATPase
VSEITYVIDTSVFLTDANSIYSYGKNDIIIPLKVLEEIDKHKTRQDTVGANARKVIRTLDELRTRGKLFDGVKLSDDHGYLSVKGYDIVNSQSILPFDLDPRLPDHIIMATALVLRNTLGNDKVRLVTNDINMRVIGDVVGLTCEDFNSKLAAEDRGSTLYSGLQEISVLDSVIDDIYEGSEVILNHEDVQFKNQYVLLRSSLNAKKTAMVKQTSPDEPVKRVNTTLTPWNLNSRNKEQIFAFDALMDPSIPVVTLVGKAGTGKTLCAIAAGLEQALALGRGSKKMRAPVDGKPYSRLIISRPVQPLGKDIGFLPGTMEEKMQPWLMPIQDNLQYLLGDDRATLEMYMEDGIIEVEALTYIRGRSISNAYIIIDEAQNLSIHELKTIITRVGNNSKIVLTGDIEQIDNLHVDETSNGLAYAVEKFKAHKIAAHITLTKGERSEVATIAAEIL